MTGVSAKDEMVFLWDSAYNFSNGIWFDFMPNSKYVLIFSGRNLELYKCEKKICVKSFVSQYGIWGNENMNFRIFLGDDRF